MIAAALDMLKGAGVEAQRLPVVEHFVAGLREQQVARRPRDARDGERTQLVEVLVEDLEPLARIQVLLPPAVRREVVVRAHGGIDQHGARTALLGRVRGVEAAERAADEGEASRVDIARKLEDVRHRDRRAVLQFRHVQRRTRRAGQRGHRIAQLTRLRTRRRRAKAVQVDDRRRAQPTFPPVAAPSTSSAPSAASSFACTPPKPPLLITST
jgi:hypothetical protein